MVDEFMVCVDRLIVASTCIDEKEIEKVDNALVSISYKNKDENNTIVMIKECRICQEEDNDDDLESPCACNGTLKFAHRKCIQKWCNKKGDITCEICNQVYSPNYTIPSVKSGHEVMTIDIRQSWAPHIDLGDHHHFLALTDSERELYQSEYDEYALANSNSIACLRSVAILLMFILIIRQTLMITKEFGAIPGSSTFFDIQISVLQLAGFLLPCYVMARSCYVFHSRRRRQG